MKDYSGCQSVLLGKFRELSPPLQKLLLLFSHWCCRCINSRQLLPVSNCLFWKVHPAWLMRMLADNPQLLHSLKSCSSYKQCCHPESCGLIIRKAAHSQRLTDPGTRQASLWLKVDWRFPFFSAALTCFPHSEEPFLTISLTRSPLCSLCF